MKIFHHLDFRIVPRQAHSESEMSSNQPCTLKSAASFSLLREATRVGIRVGLAFVVVLGLVSQSLRSAPAAEVDTNTASTATTETNNQETLRAYLQLQEQLHLTQLAIEQNRREAKETAAQNSDLLVGRMQTIEKALETERTRELETMQSSNRTVLLVAGIFAGVGFVAVLLMSFFQWRTVNRLAEISAALPASLALAAPSAHNALGAGDSRLVTVSPAEQSNLKLLGALERLEKRIYELEHTTSTPLHEGMTPSNGGKTSTLSSSEDSGAVPNLTLATSSGTTSPPSEGERVSMLLGKGVSMLNLDNAEAAAACFDEVLAIEPGNAEAWVRKGTALEKLQQLKEAVECYDHAIAANSSLTIAYLHKGGLFNRMERFNEALECYEKALRTQEKHPA
jgi:tetratricopeptide (TPR) repeat protein